MVPPSSQCSMEFSWFIHVEDINTWFLQLKKKPWNERQFGYSPKLSRARCHPYGSPMWPTHIETIGAILHITSLTLSILHVQPGQKEDYLFPEGSLTLREKSDGQRVETDSRSTAIKPGRVFEAHFLSSEETLTKIHDLMLTPWSRRIHSGLPGLLMRRLVGMSQGTISW